MNGTSKHDVDSATKRTGIDGNLPSLFLAILKIYDGTFLQNILLLLVQAHLPFYVVG